METLGSEGTRTAAAPPTGNRPAGGPRVSVVVFCSRNEDRPLEVLTELRRWLAASGLDHEVVIAFDADRAAFAGLVERQAEGAGSRPRLVVLSARQGQLATIRAGVAASTGRFVVTLPAFPQVDLSAI